MFRKNTIHRQGRRPEIARWFASVVLTLVSISSHAVNCANTPPEGNSGDFGMLYAQTATSDGFCYASPYKQTNEYDNLETVDYTRPIDTTRFVLMLPDDEPRSGATYPVRAVFVPPAGGTARSAIGIATCFGAAISFTGGFTMVEIGLADGSSCLLHMVANDGSDDIVYDATLLRTGNVYYTTNASIKGGVFGTGGETTKPSILSIVRQSPSTSPTSADSLTWRITFDEPVMNVSADDFRRTGTTATFSVNTVSSSVYDVTLSGGDLAGLNGTITMFVASGIGNDIRDLAGNSLASTTPTGTNNNSFGVENFEPEIDVQRPAASSIADGGTDAQGNKAVGAPVTLTYTVSNQGTATLSVSNVMSANADNVSVDSISPTTLNVAAGATDTFTVQYTPSASGPFSFDLDITSDDADEANYDITVSGVGAVPEIDVQRPSGNVIADGGTDTIGSGLTPGTQYTLIYTVGNSGGATLSVTDISSSNATNVSVDAISPTNFDVAAGTSTTVTVRFTPIAGGTFSFDLDIASNDADEANYDIAFSGSAAAPEIDLQRPAGNSIADGTGDAQGNRETGIQVTLSYTVANTGSAVLNVSNIAGTNPSNVTVDSISPSMLNIDGGGTGTFTVIYTPTAAGAFSFDLDIASNDGDEANYDIAVSGTGTDTTAPGVTILNAPTTFTDTTPFSVSFEFSETVVGFTQGDVTVGNGVVGNFVAVDGNSYTADVTPNGNGDVTIDVAAGQAQDGAGNDNTAAVQVTVADGRITLPAPGGVGEAATFTYTATQSDGITPVTAMLTIAATASNPPPPPAEAASIASAIDIRSTSSVNGYRLVVEFMLAPTSPNQFTGYWKYGRETAGDSPHWYDYQTLGVNGDGTGYEISTDGKILTIYLIDGVRGDDDLQANGSIDDPALLIIRSRDINPTAVPVLPVWALLTLILLLSLLGLRNVRKIG